jgi:hypothetical protein
MPDDLSVTVPPPAPPATATPAAANPPVDSGLRRRQIFEGWTLSFALLAAVGLTFIVWRFSREMWACVAIAGLAGVVAGLLHSVKWFYRTIPTGEWQSNKVWWRFMNPLVSGVMAFSIYIIFRSGIGANPTTSVGIDTREPYYAYSIGFLTGLFADNAMSKLRDIAYTLFGPTAPPASKMKQPPGKHGPEGPSGG